DAGSTPATSTFESAICVAGFFLFYRVKWGLGAFIAAELQRENKASRCFTFAILRNDEGRYNGELWGWMSGYG
ncbi:MAG: hypothetical protein IIW87_08155, partial [Alistipes sp.]|nr:hypothetical protein [Alistipes sp.]